ncbi:MAG: DoxX family protein [Gammaproteobacteria bacterium]
MPIKNNGLTESSKTPPDIKKQPSLYTTTLRLLLALFFIVGGILHFLKTPLYMKIMPSFLPYHAELVYISGFFEILGGIGVLIPALRRYAGYGLIALTIAVTPANIQMAIDHLSRDGLTLFSVLLLLRVPLQLLIIYWIYKCTR